MNIIGYLKGRAKLLNLLKDVRLQLVLSALMMTLAFAPINLPIFLIPSFYLLLKNIYLTTFKTAFKHGLIFGYCHFVTSLYWIGIALTSNVGNFLWLMPFAIILIPLTLSLYVAITCAISASLLKNKALFVLGFSLLWCIAEYIRSYWPLPFPWNCIGYVIAFNEYTIKLAPILGIYFSSLLVIILSTVFYINKKILTLFLYCCALTIILLVNIPSYKPQLMANSIRIVQPNIAEHHLGDPKKQKEALLKLVELSTINTNSDTNIVIWPEASYPYLFKENFTQLEVLRLIAPDKGYLIFGADRINNGKIYNSLITIDSRGNVLSRYDKRILVPFGEYVPLKQIFTFINNIAYTLGEISIGEKYTPNFEIDSVLSFFPVICYEVIFPINQSLNEYNWLLNVTNDAWFGNSSGPYQHLAMAQFKAAENGMPLLRIANTGISALISPKGKILNSISLNSEGFLDVKLPKKVTVNRVISKTYDIFILIISFLICLCLNLIIENHFTKNSD